ncbi:hypothetical protein V6N12_056954 [Hibiscus sabdariffa]|uniref:Polyketide cyclase / dehydrase and lipid transport n=1 Tax=Hibiscus sabdariffa TaxID=183260 RepID=A0ABR2DCX2_9ROSI
MKGRAYAKLAGCKAEQVWPLLQDFFGLDKWFPTLTTCLPVQGVSGQPGCVRFCAGFKIPLDEGDKVAINWTKQRLLPSIEQLAFGPTATYWCCRGDGN